MKKLVFLLLLLPALCFAGEKVTLPYNVVVGDPLTDQAEKIKISIIYSDDSNNHFASLEYWVVNQAGTEVLYEFSFQIRNIPDNPESITANCIASQNPWPLCTGAGTCTDDCDESTTDFNDFVAGFASTLNSRAEAAMSQDLQSKKTTQAKP